MRPATTLRARAFRRGAATVLAAVLLAVAAGCGGSDEPGGGTLTLPPLPSASPSASPSGGSVGVVYKLSGDLCAKADQSPFADLYPKEDAKPLVATEKLCVTHRTSGERGVDLTIDANLMRDEATAKLFVETGRRLAKRPVTSVSVGGSDAYWSGDKDDVKLTSYRGNLVLELEAAVNEADGMPPDVVQRLVRVAEGTYAKLAP